MILRDEKTVEIQRTNQPKERIKKGKKKGPKLNKNFKKYIDYNYVRACLPRKLKNIDLQTKPRKGSFPKSILRKQN